MVTRLHFDGTATPHRPLALLGVASAAQSLIVLLVLRVLPGQVRHTESATLVEKNGVTNVTLGSGEPQVSGPRRARSDEN